MVASVTCADILPHIKTSLWFTDICLKKRKCPVSALGQNALLMPEIRQEQPDFFKLIRTLVRLRYAEEHL